MNFTSNHQDIAGEDIIQILFELPSAIIISRNYSIIFGNKCALSLLQASDISELIGKNIQDFIVPSIITKNNGDEHEEQWTTLTGQILDIITQTSIIQFQGEVAEYTTLVNITRQKQSEQNLNELQKSYKSLVANSIDAIGVVTNDEFIYMNPSGIKMLGGKTKQDIIYKHIFTFVHPDFHDICIERMARIIEHDEIPKLMEQKMFTLDGKTINIEIIGFPIIYNGENAVQVIFRDITEFKQSQEVIIHSEKLSTVGKLAAGIAHEIRNPLTSLKGFLQLLTLDTTSINKYLPIFKSEIDRIEMISGELIALAKPFPQEFVRINMVDLLNDVIFLIETEAFRKNIAITNKIKEHIILINAVGMQMKQVFLNLLKNSIESMNHGGSIEVEVVLEPTIVSIHIRDEGSGISKENLKHIFDPFFTTKSEGTGLGLMVTQNIIENHGGEIKVSSIEGKGTTFTIMIPMDT